MNSERVKNNCLIVTIVTEVSRQSRNPVAGLVEDGFECDVLRFLLGELPTPRNALFLTGTLPCVVVFEIAGGLFVFRIPPVLPSFGSDVSTEFAIHEERVGVWPPRTPQIDLIGFLRGGESAMVENVTIRLVGRC